MREIVEILREIEENKTEKSLFKLLEYLLKNNFISKEIHELLQNVIYFSETIVREIMIPRTDVIAVNENISFEELKDIFKKFKYSRIPVYKENIDNIIGIVYSKDLLGISCFDLKKIMRDPYFVPETKKIVQLLKDFKENKVKIAIVVDEFGGVSGLVTLMDILEEITGDIRDEDTEDKPEKIIELNDGNILVDSRTSIEEIRKYLNIDLEEGPYDTIGGFVIKKLGRLPEKGEIIHQENFEIIVNDVYEKGIKNLIIKK